MDMHLPRKLVRPQMQTHKSMRNTTRRGDGMNLEIKEKIEETEHHLQRLKVIQRDHVCQCCGYDECLISHTIIEGLSFPKDDISNQVALCKWCHGKYHAVYPGKANIRDFLQFLRRFGSR